MTQRGKAVAFQFYASDWLTDDRVREMPLAARGAYVHMLCAAFMAGGTLRDDQRALRKAADAEPDEWADLWPYLEPCWPLDSAGRRHNPKLTDVLDAQAALREKRAAAGSRGGKQAASKREANPLAKEKEKEKEKEASEVELPRDLDTPEVRAAWSDYERHRSELRKKLTPTARTKALRKLAKLAGLDPAMAVQVLEETVANGWTGIHASGTGPTNGRQSERDRNQEWLRNELMKEVQS